MKLKLLISFGLCVVASFCQSHAQLTTRDQRWPTRGPWMWAVQKELPQFYIELNGIDFGHAHLAETLLRTQDEQELERARVEVLDFIFSRPPVPPDEEQITPTLTRGMWELQRTFNWAHELHRSFYEVLASPKVRDKDLALKKVLNNYLSKPEAITPHHLDMMGKLYSFPESGTFRKKFPKFAVQIWSYHWLQGAAYDAQLMGDAAQQRQYMAKLIEHYHGYLKNPPLDWQFMPMISEGAPEFATRYPEAAAIFDNLHMIHDNLDDILSRPDLYPTIEAKRDAILKIHEIYLYRNHQGKDRYADYHMPPEQMKEMEHMAMMKMGGKMDDTMKMKMEGMKGMEPAGAKKSPEGKQHSEHGQKESKSEQGGKTADSKAGHEHGGKQKSGEKEADWSRKPETAEWQKKAPKVEMKGDMKHGEMKGMKDGKMGSMKMKGMKGMEKMGGMEGMSMAKMGPRPPTAREVIEGNAHEKEHGGGHQSSHPGQGDGDNHADSKAQHDKHAAQPQGEAQLRQANEPRDLKNLHSSKETGIDAQNVSQLRLAWKIKADDYVTHTPILHENHLYFTDWSGSVYSADARTGELRWKKKIYEPEKDWAWHGFAGKGAVANDLLIEVSVEGDVYGIDLKSGEVRWKTDVSPENKYGGSFNTLLSHEGLVYVGLSSVEEHIAEGNPDYKPSFRGKIVALHASTGKIAWRKSLVEEPANGCAIWTTFAFDPEGNTLFASTGNNYSGAPTKLSDAVIALDAKTGEIRWSKQVFEGDVWSPAEPVSLDYDFAGGPQLFEAAINGKSRKLVGAGQKSGIYWALDRENGDIVWQASISYGGVAGGLHGDASIGDGAIYVWGNNYFDHNIPPEEFGLNVAAIDAATGKILWKQAKIQQAALLSAGFLSKDVYLVPSLDGKIHAYRTSNGEKLWESEEVPGPLSSSLAVIDNTIFYTSGMPKQFGYYEGENGVYAYTISGEAKVTEQKNKQQAISEKSGSETKKSSGEKHEHK